MNRDDVTSRLRAILKRQEQIQVDVDSVTEETQIDQVGFDSLSILDFMYDVEDQFKTHIDIADLVKMEIVGDLVDYLEGKLVR